MEHIIKTIQSAIFTRNLDFAISGYNKATFLEELGNKLGDIFDDEPVFVPIPNNAPPEIPRVILNSKNRVFSCNISLSRTDLVFNVINNTNNINPYDIQKINLLRIATILLGKGAIITRIGFVVDIEFVKQDSLDFIKANFIQEGKFVGPKELLVRYNSTSLLDTVTMNNLITISGSDKGALMTQLDINTSPELMNHMTFDEIVLEKVINYSIVKTKRILKDFPIV